MFSICIPIYNVDVNALVSELLIACEASKLPFQIICLDDCSALEFDQLNQSLSEKINVSYIRLSENVGRSKIRNKLAKLARFENLIFLDCDGIAVPTDFVQDYESALQNYDVVYGGRKYAAKYPSNSEYWLHYNYGVKREALSASVRMQDPAISAMTNNFAIKAKIFEKFQFDEGIEGYGYEDLVFFHKLAQNGYTIGHIDNALVHNSLDNNEAFIQKTEIAISNLVKLHSQNKVPETKLIKLYKKLSFVIGNISESKLEKYMEWFSKKLISSHRISFLDAMKLLWFSKYSQKNKG